MVNIVTPPAYENSCAEVWVDPSTLSTEDPVLAERAAIDATWSLWSLSGERFHGAQCWVDDYRTINGYCNIRLDNNPVVEVVAVSRMDMCGDAVTATGIGVVTENWCYKGGNELRVCCSSGGGLPSVFSPSYGQTLGAGFYGGTCSCSSSGSVVRVHYKVGNNLPPGAPAAAFRMAEEYVKASQGKACALPERVTNINRQGVSWTILDPQDFLSDGLTGIGPVDQWLAQVGLRSRWMTMTDPLRSVPRVKSTLVGCGDDDCFSDLSP